MTCLFIEPSRLVMTFGGAEEQSMSHKLI